MTLKEMMDQTAELEQQLEESGGELTPELEETLDNLANDLNNKVDAYGYLLNRMKSKAEAIKGLVKEMQAKQKAAENNYNRLKDSLAYTMALYGHPKLEGGVYTISTRTTNSVDVDEETLLKPYTDTIAAIDEQLPKYIKMKPSISKTALKELADAGNLPEGATIATNTSISVR